MSRNERGGRGPGNRNSSGRHLEPQSMMDDRLGERRSTPKFQDSRHGTGRGTQSPHSPHGDGGYSSESPRNSPHGTCPTRLEGFVVTLKEAYGFVQSVDSERQYFFHYSEVRVGSPRDLRTGTELSFDVFEPRNGEKPTATNVSILPKGSIKLEVDVGANLRGVINKEPRERREDRRDNKQIIPLLTGRIKSLPEQTNLAGEAAPEFAAFGADDVVALPDGSPYKPHAEDEVLFDVVLVRATKQLRAVRVRLVKAKEEPRETGVVATLKESFGFIQCCDRDERLFFPNEARGSAAPFREGDEVEFTVERDREGRNMARNVRLLPRGTVSFERVLAERVVGTVDRELRASKKTARGHGGGAGSGASFGKELSGGLVVCDFEGQPLRLPFENEDVELTAGGGRFEEAQPLRGDGVEIDVVVHKPTGRKRAARLRVVKFSQEGREQGIVIPPSAARGKDLGSGNAGPGMALIRCSDRAEPLPFRLAELGDGDDAAAGGPEVSFNVVEGRDGRPVAVRLERLAAGTVTFETVLEGPFRATVVSTVATGAGPSPRHTQGKQKKVVKDLPTGMVRLDGPLPDQAALPSGNGNPAHDGSKGDHSKEEAVSGSGGRGGRRGDGSTGLELGFGWGSQADPAAVLRRGDAVTVAVIIDRPTKTRRAIRVKLDGPASPAVGESAEAFETEAVQGTVVSVKSSGGFIRCADRDTRVYFCQSDLDPASMPPHVPPPTTGSAGTSPERRAAVAMAPADAHVAVAGEDLVGEEEDEGDEEGGEGHDRESEEEGNSPEPAVAVAAAVPATTNSGEGGRRGGRGRGGKGKKSAVALRLGDEVEFHIYNDPRSRVVKAVKIRSLPADSVVLQAVVAEKQRGVVEKEAAAGKAGTNGTIRCAADADASVANGHGTNGSTAGANPISGGGGVTLSFWSADVESTGPGGCKSGTLGRGDPVEFSIMADRATGERWAVRVAALPHEGVVDSLKESYGYIRPDRCNDHEGGGGGGGPSKLVVFYFSEVERGDQGKIEKGDTVQFWMQASRGKEASATRIKRIFRMKESPLPDSLRRHHPHSAKAMSRTAAGPDGTRGFHAGRGRALAPPLVIGSPALGPAAATAARPSFDALAAVVPEFTPGKLLWTPTAGGGAAPAQFADAPGAR